MNRVTLHRQKKRVVTLCWRSIQPLPFRRHAHATLCFSGFTPSLPLVPHSMEQKVIHFCVQKMRWIGFNAVNHGSDRLFLLKFCVLLRSIFIGELKHIKIRAKCFSVWMLERSNINKREPKTNDMLFCFVNPPQTTRCNGGKSKVKLEDAHRKGSKSFEKQCRHQLRLEAELENVKMSERSDVNSNIFAQKPQVKTCSSIKIVFHQCKQRETCHTHNERQERRLGPQEGRDVNSNTLRAKAASEDLQQHQNCIPSVQQGTSNFKLRAVSDSRNQRETYHPHNERQERTLGPRLT